MMLSTLLCFVMLIPSTVSGTLASLYPKKMHMSHAFGLLYVVYLHDNGSFEV